MAFPTGWSRRVALTIDDTHIGSNLSGFVLYVGRANLPNAMCDPSSSAAAQTNGGDIRFSVDSAGATQLPCEVVAFEHDSATSAGDASIELYVRLPSVSSTVGTVVYLWWKPATTETQPAVTDTYGRNAVWVDYAAVYHLSSTGSQIDATGNGVSLTEAGSGHIADSGVLGASIDLPGSTNAYYVGGIGSPSISSLGVQGATFSAWVRPDTIAADQNIVGVGNSGATNPLFRLALANGKGLAQYRDNDGHISNAFSFSNLTVDAWVHLHAVIQSGGSTQCYRDGAPSGSAGSISGGVDHGITVDHTEIGGLNRGTVSQTFNGNIDEARIIAQAQTADHIAADHANQNSPATFMSTGSVDEIAPGAGVTLTPGTGDTDAAGGESAAAAGQSLGPGAGGGSADGNAPALDAGHTATPGAAAAAAEGGAPALSAGEYLAPGSGGGQAGGDGAAPGAGASLEPGSGDADAEGGAPAFVTATPVSVTPGAGGATAAGGAPSIADAAVGPGLMRLTETPVFWMRLTERETARMNLWEAPLQ